MLQTVNVAWKRNRNAYARLLLEQLQAGVLEAPFHVCPPSAPLATLPQWTLYSATHRSSPSRYPPCLQMNSTWTLPARSNIESAAMHSIEQTHDITSMMAAQGSVTHPLHVALQLLCFTPGTCVSGPASAWPAAVAWHTAACAQQRFNVRNHSQKCDIMMQTWYHNCLWLSAHMLAVRATQLTINKDCGGCRATRAVVEGRCMDVVSAGAGGGTWCVPRAAARA